jgi:hypothetical protein
LLPFLGFGCLICFAIVTTAAAPSVAQYHNRMPVVLDDSQFDDWMRGTPDQAAEMMKPYTGAIEAWEVQLTGHALLRARGIELVPVDGPTYFTDPSPTAEMVRQILGAVSQFEKAGLVAKLKHGRDAKRAATGRCEGRRPVPEAVVAVARRLAEVTQDGGAP